MLTFDETAEILDEILAGFPGILLDGLSGVFLVDALKYSEDLPDGNHIVMGAYVRSRGLRPCVDIYYGSVMEKYLDADVETVQTALRGILAHELRHHAETLAGCDDLVRLDAAYVAAEKTGHNE